MSRSYHATFSELKGKTKKELDEMAKDPESVLDELATKSLTKKTVIKKRKENEGQKSDTWTLCNRIGSFDKRRF